MKFFYLQLQSNRHICPYTSIVDEFFLSIIEIFDGVDLLGDGVDLLVDGGDLLGDGVDLLGDSGDPRSIAGGSSKTTVAQKCPGAIEIQKYHQPTYQPTDMGRCWRH